MRAGERRTVLFFVAAGRSYASLDAGPRCAVFWVVSGTVGREIVGTPGAPGRGCYRDTPGHRENAVTPAHPCARPRPREGYIYPGKNGTRFTVTRARTRPPATTVPGVSPEIRFGRLHKVHGAGRITSRPALSACQPSRPALLSRFSAWFSGDLVFSAWGSRPIIL